MQVWSACVPLVASALLLAAHHLAELTNHVPTGSLGGMHITGYPKNVAVRLISTRLILARRYVIGSAREIKDPIEPGLASHQLGNFHSASTLALLYVICLIY